MNYFITTEANAGIKLKFYTGIAKKLKHAMMQLCNCLGITYFPASQGNFTYQQYSTCVKSCFITSNNVHIKPFKNPKTTTKSIVPKSITVLSPSENDILPLPHYGTYFNIYNISQAPYLPLFLLLLHIPYFNLKFFFPFNPFFFPLFELPKMTSAPISRNKMKLSRTVFLKICASNTTRT